jgi:hypothetical protein
METTDVNESRVLATDLMHVSTELGKLVTTQELPRVLHNSDSNKGIVKFDWNIK